MDLGLPLHAYGNGKWVEEGNQRENGGFSTVTNRIRYKESQEKDGGVHRSESDDASELSSAAYIPTPVR